MSGIAGVVSFDGAPVSGEEIARMIAAMAHRGPDGVSSHFSSVMGFGHCMLHTTPESLLERQPWCSDDGELVLTMDGRIDNRDELYRELRGTGRTPRNQSDAELVLLAYEKWGESVPAHLIGDFVFFIWDGRRQYLFGARDAAGSRHFYYHAAHHCFSFASEIRALLATGRIQIRLNEERLLDYLVVEYDRDDETGTFYQGIERLPAGHAMRVQQGRVQSWRYWNPLALSPLRFSSQAECAEAFLDQLREAVRCRLRGHGQLGAMLSGGLDSSSIVALIGKEFRNQLESPLQTYSLIRDDRENCTDWPGIQAVLRNPWFDSTVITSAQARSAAPSYLRKIPELDEPLLLTDGFPESLLLDAAQDRGCRIMLEGMAGDLLFYSSTRSLDAILRQRMFSYLPAQLAAYRRHGISWSTWRLLLQASRVYAPDFSIKLFRRLRQAFSVYTANAHEMPGDLLGLMHRSKATDFLARREARRLGQKEAIVTGDERSRHAFDFMSGSISYANEYMGLLAAARGVEIRSPFSDQRLLEFAICMPCEAKLAAPWYKNLLRVCMRGILPDEVRWRRKLGGHPGWKFFDELVNVASAEIPGVWGAAFHGDSLDRWFDTDSLVHARHEFEKNASYPLGYNLLLVVSLAAWLASKPSEFIE